LRIRSDRITEFTKLNSENFVILSKLFNLKNIVIAIDGTSASGKSTNAKLVARALNFVYVDTGAMYRTLAWHCLKNKIDVDDAKAVTAACRKWKMKLECVEKNHLRTVHLLVDNYFPEKEMRTAEVTAAVSQVAAIPKVRDWMKRTQRDCIQFGNLVMEGRDIGTNVFPETDFKFYLDAKLEERSARRAADGVHDNLAARDQRDSQRAAAPLMIALGAKVLDNSKLSSAETSGWLLREIRAQLPPEK
jgi:cytidylate kinase